MSSKQPQYMIISLPTGISSTNDSEEAFSALRAGVSTDNGAVVPFHVPEFKVGTLDALVQQAEELSKLESTCEAVAGKVGESLKNILEGDEEKIAQQKMVNDSMLAGKLETYERWLIRSRTCGSLSELIQLEQGQVPGGSTNR
jgi:V-type H+-transporting ATPase subunit C